MLKIQRYFSYRHFHHMTVAKVEALLEAVGLTSRTAVSEASAIGADLTIAAVGAVEGAIDVAKETGLNVEEAAAAAATGAIEAAGDVSSAAAVRVRRSVEGTIQGVKVVAKTAVGKEGSEE